MLSYLFGNTSGKFDSFQIVLEVIVILALLTIASLIIYLNVSAFKLDRKTFIKEYWKKLDIFDKFYSLILASPAWIYFLIQYLWGTRRIPLKKFQNK